MHLCVSVTVQIIRYNPLFVPSKTKEVGHQSAGILRYREHVASILINSPLVLTFISTRLHALSEKLHRSVVAVRRELFDAITINTFGLLWHHSSFVIVVNELLWNFVQYSFCQ